MEIVYSQTRHPIADGRTQQNPRFFSGPLKGATAVFVVGDFPRIVEAYCAAGVKVEVIGGPEAPSTPASAPESLTPVAQDRGAVEIPEGWQSLPYTGKAHALTLRQLAALVSDEPILNKAQAVAAIEAELERRKGPTPAADAFVEGLPEFVEAVNADAGE